MSGDLERIGQFGEYEVWETDGRDWHITDRNGDFIYPGDDDLLQALTLIADRRKSAKGEFTP